MGRSHDHFFKGFHTVYRAIGGWRLGCVFGCICDLYGYWRLYANCQSNACVMAAMCLERLAADIASLTLANVFGRGSRRLFQEMKDNNVDRTVEVYNALMKGKRDMRLSVDSSRR
jgi:hypothetical protein